MEYKEIALALTEIRRGETVHMERDEEGFILNEEGVVVTSLLPGETRRVTRREGKRLLRLPREGMIYGVCGASLPGEDGELTGLWGTFSCQMLSPACFARRNARSLAEGKTPAEIMSGSLRPLLKLAAFHTETPFAAKFLDEQALPMMRDEALRHGASLTHYRTAFWGRVEGA